MPINMNELAHTQISASVSGTEQVQALAGAMNSVASAQEGLTRQQKAFLANIGRMEQTFGKTRSEVLRFKAEVMGVSAIADPVISKLVKMGIDGEHSFSHLIQSGGVFREMLVLIHESLIMGNWSRFGGSLMVLAERLGISAAMFTGLGGAITAAVAAQAALYGGMIEGELQSTRLARALALTGNMAGITEGQFNAMAESIGKQIPGSVLSARSALQELVSTGQFTGDTLGSVARAAVEYSKYSGESVQKSVEFFAEMKDGAAKFGAKANESLHFLTEAQYNYIDSLERSGQVEAAQKAVADDFFHHVANTGTQNLGYLEQAIDAVSNKIHGLWNDLESIGRTTTPADQLAALLGQKKAVDDQLATQPSGGFGANFGQGRSYLLDKEKKLQAEIAAKQKEISDQEKAAAAQAKADQRHQAGIQAVIALKTKFSAPPDQLKVAIAEYNKTIAQAVADNPNNAAYKGLAAHDASYKAEIARLTKEYGGHSGGRSNSLAAADTSRLQTQLSMMEQYARATHQSETAVLQLEIAQGKLKGFTAAQIQQLQGIATRHDHIAAVQEQVALQTRYGDQFTKLVTGNAATAQQVQQLATTGKVTPPSELQKVNLMASQGNLQGITPEQLAALQAQATTTDLLTAQKDQLMRSSTFGTQNAFASYIDQATNAGAQVKKVWGDTFNGMENLLVTALEGGKVSFRAFAASVVADLLKMQVEENIMAPLVKMLGGVGGGVNGAGLPGILGGAGGGIIGGLMSGFGTGKAMSTASLVAHQGGSMSMLQGLGSWAASFFANGGIMTSRGSIPLNMYANGGVANSPQMAVFGEGRGPEAYVPLPDGRSIPVSMKGGGGGGQMNNITNHITVNSDGSSQATPQDASRLAQGITQAIQQEMIRQARDGGILSPTGGVFGAGAFS
ncbi:phage tail length tape measure family protein [Acidocella facilis]|uniref:phage tail length tape measure family protein n=1 Tax=Acidocella facilis TaxID=525 RepID=UPI001F30FF4C|nr:phage tail length tape measure family protein [Acidocella facilis]